MRATLVQVTNLGLAVKDSPQNTLVFVTRLDTGAPVSGAHVSIVRLDRSIFWTGTTGADGVAIAPRTALRDPRKWQELSFIVTAEKDGDLAYVGSDWHEGIEPWMFNTHFDLNQASPMLRGSVFTDRGVYRSGEEVHVKAILRHNTASGIRPLPEGTAVWVTTRDSRAQTVDDRVVTIGKWSSAEWVLKLPTDAALGSWSVRAVLAQDKPKPPQPGVAPPPGAAPSWQEPGEQADLWVPYEKQVEGEFLVAAYRRPDFRVDVTLSSDTPVAGVVLKGMVGARYLFGAPMSGRPVAWTFSRSPLYSAPDAVYRTFERDRWVFVGRPDDNRREGGELGRNEGTLSKTGDLPLDLKTPVVSEQNLRCRVQGCSVQGARCEQRLRCRVQGCRGAGCASRT